MSKTPRRRADSPFDPRKAKGAEPSLFAPTASPGPGVVTVSQVTRMVQSAIVEKLPATLHVVGELSNLSQPAAGHLYFTLKDASSELRCVMWKSATTGLKFELSDGLEVLATGSVDVYEPRGQYQFYVRKLEPRGQGALELAFQQLKDRLAKEGLFDPSRKRPLPKFPRRIAVVTSPTGAALQDILRTIQRRYPAVEVVVVGVRVQGDGAAEEIADAIRLLNTRAKQLGGIDAMIVGRGGGSLEELWAFNEEAVARAIHASAIPVVSAVGHETDFTIADFVADVRAATPTAAAELVVPVLADLIDSLDKVARRLRGAATRTIEQLLARLTVAAKCEWFRDPLSRLGRAQQRIDESQGRLAFSQSRLFEMRRKALHDAEMRLSRLRPEAVLARRRERLGEMRHRLCMASERSTRRLVLRLSDFERRWTAALPAHRLNRRSILLDQLHGRLQRGIERRQADVAKTLESMQHRLSTSSHEATLQRGYTITRRVKDGRLIRSASDVAEDDVVETRTAAGAFTSRVEPSADEPAD